MKNSTREISQVVLDSLGEGIKEVKQYLGVLGVMGVIPLYPILTIRWYRKCRELNELEDARAFAFFGTLGAVGILGVVSAFFAPSFLWAVVIECAFGALYLWSWSILLALLLKRSHEKERHGV